MFKEPSKIIAKVLTAIYFISFNFNSKDTLIYASIEKQGFF